MEVTVSLKWWVWAIRGVFAVLFGLLTLAWPALTLEVLVLLFGAYALVDGVFAILGAVRAAERRMSWWPLAVEGVVGILAGILTFLWPGLTALVLLYLIAFWAILTGILEIAAAVRLRREIEGEVLLAISGIASLLFGLVLVAFPGSGALALLWLIGVYAIFFGVLELGVAFRLYGRSQRRLAPA